MSYRKYQVFSVFLSCCALADSFLPETLHVNCRRSASQNKSGPFGVSVATGLTGKSVPAENDGPLRKRSIKSNVAAMVSRMRRSQFKESPSTAAEMERLRRENVFLRESIKKLEIENDRLESSSRIVLETFEGEGKLRDIARWRSEGVPVTLTGEEMLNGDPALWCYEIEDDDACPVEPTVSFGVALRDRAYWLVGLLTLQSLSGFILAHNQALLSDHPVVVYFLTMLVGAGGNAGNQASVRVIRGLALGTLNEQTQGQFLTRELKMAVALSSILSVAGFLRAAAFHTPFPETIAVTCALSMIVFSSVCLGAVLPLVLQRLGVDPAHSSTTIQVVMDILGVVVTVVVSSALLDSPLGRLLVDWLSRSRA